MKKAVCVWKPIGFTPLQVIFKFKEKYPEYKEETVSYAGRLDPMAEGILVLLVGEENKNRDKYLGLDKQYETEIIFGVSTDTFDSLGLISEKNQKDINKKDILNVLDKYRGKQKQEYPPFSSKTVEGKPLYWWAREKKLGEIKIPQREIEFYEFELLDFEKININDLVSKIIGNVKLIDGDFRQKEIIKNWKKFQKENKVQRLIQAKIKISCSSGTYIRRFADDLGKELGTCAFAFSIQRIRVGKHTINDCQKISA